MGLGENKSQFLIAYVYVYIPHTAINKPSYFLPNLTLPVWGSCSPLQVWGGQSNQNSKSPKLLKLPLETHIWKRSNFEKTQSNFTNLNILKNKKSDL